MCIHMITGLAGRRTRTRTCKSGHRCLLGAMTRQLNDCLSQPCSDESDQTLSSTENQTIAYWDNDSLVVILIVLFPVCFTLLCLPLCVLYYVYELDFKLHALTVRLCSLYSRGCQTTRGRINISR
jgi:hypothetical protein